MLADLLICNLAVVFILIWWWWNWAILMCNWELEVLLKSLQKITPSHFSKGFNLFYKYLYFLNTKLSWQMYCKHLPVCDFLFFSRNALGCFGKILMLSILIHLALHTIKIYSLVYWYFSKMQKYTFFFAFYAICSHIFKYVFAIYWSSSLLMTWYIFKYVYT